MSQVIRSGDDEGGGWIFKAISIVAALYALAGGTVSLLGWVLDRPRFYDWDLDGISIKSNAAICVILAGLGLLTWAVMPKLKWIVRIFGAITALIAGLTVLEHIFEVELGIDTLLFIEEPGAGATSAPGRMGIPASVSLTFIGSALLSLTFESARRWAWLLGAAALSISALSLIGYGYGANQLFAIPRFTGIAWQTATMISALGTGLLFVVPYYGFAQIASREDAGGMIFRRLVAPVIAISVAMGWLQLAGQESGLYDAPFGSAIRTFVEIFLLIGALWWAASGVSKREIRIREGTAALRARDEEIRGVLQSLSDAFIALDRELKFKQINAAASHLFERNGLDPFAMIGKHVFDVMPEARESTLGNGLIRAHATREPAEMEEYFPPFERWFHARFLPTDGGGTSIFALDVTGSKDAEMLVRRRAHELAVLYGFADRLNRANSLEDVYAAALDTIISALDCGRASILMFDEQGVMRFVAERGLSESYKSAVTGHSPWNQGEKGAVPIGIEDIKQSDVEPDLRDVIVREGIIALGFIPLISNDVLIGKFMVYYDRPHQFTDAEFEIAMTVGYQIAFGVERKRTEENLKENEERLRIATQTGKVGVWDWDIRNNLVSWTPAVYTMHGVRPGEFDGRLESFAKLIYPEDREFVQERIEQALADELPYEVEFRVPQSDGTVNWLYTNAVVLRDPDGPYRMIGATINITARKMAELELARAAEIVKHSQDAIVSKDLNGIITGWNQGAERIFGYTADEIIGKSIKTLIPLERLDEEDKILERLRRGEYIEHYETVRQRKDGTLLDISLAVSPVADASGKIVGASKIARDITDRRQTEAARRDREIMKRLVEAQEAERHRIARDLHDHLGQQLTALRLKLESLRSKLNGNGTLEQEMTEIQEYASRIDLDVNYLAWELRPTELDQLGLNDAVGSFVREWSKTYGIAAEFHSNSGNSHRLHPEIETNLYRIVQEGLNNILKHARATGVNVLLEHRASQILLIIEDNGVGFDEVASQNGSPGGGLGLVGMRERTALLGGTLEIESRPGEGTTVYVRVPHEIEHKP